MKKFINQVSWVLIAVVVILLLSLFSVLLPKDFRPKPVSKIFDRKELFMKFHEYDVKGTLFSVESLKEGGANYQYAVGYDLLLSVNAPFKILTWNIGYAGMSKEIDFFYDGGTQVRPPKERVEENLDSIKKYLRQREDVEFFFLQEIDLKSKRSYDTPQFSSSWMDLHKYFYFYAINYDVSYVPMPLSDPMGNVRAGLAIAGNVCPLNCHRYSYPDNTSYFRWPVFIFMLDRCFLASRYPLDNGKELVLINTHNSAFDEGGELRKKEVAFLRDFMVKEYEKKGNYVIAGGDFNQCPIGIEPQYAADVYDSNDFVYMPDLLFPKEWSYVYDPSCPTNRNADVPYERGETKTSTIDFFIVSPNVEAKSVKTIDLQFEHSDHNPVEATFSLKN